MTTESLLSSLNFELLESGSIKFDVPKSLFNYIEKNIKKDMILRRKTEYNGRTVKRDGTGVFAGRLFEVIVKLYSIDLGFDSSDWKYVNLEYYDYVTEDGWRIEIKVKVQGTRNEKDPRLGGYEFSDDKPYRKCDFYIGGRFHKSCDSPSSERLKEIQGYSDLDTLIDELQEEGKIGKITNKEYKKLKEIIDLFEKNLCEFDFGWISGILPKEEFDNHPRLIKVRGGIPDKTNGTTMNRDCDNLRYIDMHPIPNSKKDLKEYLTKNA